LEQVGEIIEQFRQDGVVHEAYAGDRQRSVEELRADLSHVLTGMLHQRELEACVGSAGAQIELWKAANRESESGRQEPR
jgi:hypothetical protein